ncbi:MAG: tetratricopeptide repeat protein [Candidatus Amoebophilus sp.]
MKKTYSLFQQYTAYVLLISLCLQSCGGGFDNNPIIPIPEGQPPHTKTIVPRADIQPLVDQVLTADGGHAVNFYMEAGELKANVAMDAPQGFSKSYKGINVYVEQGAELATLSQLNTKAQERRIHLHPAKSNQPAKVVIYKKAGLGGGMKEGDMDEKGVEKREEDREQRVGKHQDNNNSGTAAEKQEADISDVLMKQRDLEELATQGDITAQYTLGWMYENGLEVDKDDKKALEWYEKAAGKGDKYAQYRLARKKEDERDYAKAKKWYKKAAHQGCVAAQDWLGIMYANGEGGVEQNYHKAVVWYKKAAAQGEESAQGAIAAIYDEEDELRDKFKQLIKYYQKNAEQGDGTAQYSLAWMYENGWCGLEQNNEKAFKLYKKSAERGNAAAQFSLAWMYENGEGVKKEGTKAAEWYQKAAQQGNRDAQFMLACMYYNGKAVEQDYNKAFQWYWEAAKQDHEYAKCALKNRYVNGQNREQSTKQASVIVQAAVEQEGTVLQKALAKVLKRNKSEQQLKALAKEEKGANNDKKEETNRIGGKKESTSNLVVNSQYEYEDNDIVTILRSRLTELAKQSPAYIFKQVDILGPVDNIMPNQLKKVLLQDKQHNNNRERVLLIPCNLGMCHWVGVLLKIDTNQRVTQAVYVDSLEGADKAFPDFERQIQDVYPGCNVQTLPLLKQNDTTSCGAYTIENLLLVFQDKPAPLINTEEIRRLHLECLKKHAFTFYNQFYPRQRDNIPTTTSIEQQLGYHRDLGTPRFSKQELGAMLAIYKCLSTITDKTTKGQLWEVLRPEDIDEDNQKTHLNLIRSAFKEAAIKLGDEQDKNLVYDIIEILFGCRCNESSVTIIDEADFRLQYEAILAISQIKVEITTIDATQKEIQEQIRKDEKFASQLQQKLWGEKELTKGSIDNITASISALYIDEKDNINKLALSANDNDEHAQEEIIEQCLKIGLSPLIKKLIHPLNWKGIKERALQDERYVFLLLSFLDLQTDYTLDADIVKNVQAHAEAKNLLAQTNLGWMYANGQGVSKNNVEASKWSLEAAKQGSAFAQDKLGFIYANGQGVPKNYAEALKWFLEAAKQSYAKAQYNLGLMYAHGRGIPEKDYMQAFNWIRESAIQKYVEAQYVIGLFYRNGYGVDKDYAKAKEWYEKAANQGHAKAQRELFQLKDILINRPNYLINTIAYVPYDRKLDEEDSSDEDISDEFEESMFERLTEYGTRNFPFIITSKKFLEDSGRKNKNKNKNDQRSCSIKILGDCLPGNIPPSLTKKDKGETERSTIIQPYLDKLSEGAFNSPASINLERISVSFALNRPRSLSTRRNRALYRELEATADSAIKHRKFAFFWDYPWHNCSQECYPSIVICPPTIPATHNPSPVPYLTVRSFYKQLKRYDKEHGTNKAIIFLAANEDNQKHRVPYQALRQRLKEHPQTKELVSSFTSKTPNASIYFSLIDSDVISFNSIYSAYDQIYLESKNQGTEPIVMSTGYEFPTRSSEPLGDTIKDMAPALNFASQLDRIIRVATASIIPLGVYYPEPNVCVLLPKGLPTLPESFIGEKEDKQNGDVESAILLRQAKDRKGINICPTTFVFSQRNPLITTIPPRMMLNKQGKDGAKSPINFSESFIRGLYQNITSEDIVKATEVSQSHAGKQKWGGFLYKNRPFHITVNYKQFLSQIGKAYALGNPLFCLDKEVMRRRIEDILAGKGLEIIDNSVLDKIPDEQHATLVKEAIKRSHIAIAKFLKEKVFSDKHGEASFEKLRLIVIKNE